MRAVRFEGGGGTFDMHQTLVAVHAVRIRLAGAAWSLPAARCEIYTKHYLRYMRYMRTVLFPRLAALNSASAAVVAPSRSSRRTLEGGV